MEFLEIQSSIETALHNTQLPFQLLELRYTRYAFGSGFVAYRMKGYNLMFSYDGRDSVISLQQSAKHEKYPICDWQDIVYDTPTDFLKNMKSILASLKLS